MIEVPGDLVVAMAGAITDTVGTIPLRDLVAVDLVYYAMDPGDEEPEPIDVFGCTRQRRAEILAQQPAPEGVVYIWSNLEFDTYATAQDADRFLAGPWQAVNAFAQSLYQEEIDVEDEVFDATWVPRSVLIAVCRHLNERGWVPARPPHLAADAVIFPAARGGVDPDTPDNVRAVLTTEQRRRIDKAGLLPLW